MGCITVCDTRIVILGRLQLRRSTTTPVEVYRGLRRHIGECTCGLLAWEARNQRPASHRSNIEGCRTSVLSLRD